MTGPDDTDPSPTGAIGRLRSWLLFRVATPAFDWLEQRFESDGARKLTTDILVLLFFGGIGVAELMRRGIYFEQRDVSHFMAVEVVFTGLLVIEIVGLVMGIVGSISNAMGKQIEILSLILLRDAFKQFSHFGEPLDWSQVEPYILQILADVGGALVLFVILGLYYRLQAHVPITNDPSAQRSFTAVKKLVALSMILTFVGVGAGDAVAIALGEETYPFFQTFYTIMVFADVLVVLLSLRYTSIYTVVFRNSCFTLTTVLIRLTLAAPPFHDVALGVAAGLIALFLAWAYMKFAVWETEAGARVLIPPHPTRGSGDVSPVVRRP